MKLRSLAGDFQYLDLFYFYLKQSFAYLPVHPGERLCNFVEDFQRCGRCSSLLWRILSAMRKIIGTFTFYFYLFVLTLFFYHTFIGSAIHVD